MKVEVEYKPMSKKDYDTFIDLLTDMVMDFVEKRNIKPNMFIPNVFIKDKKIRMIIDSIILEHTLW